MIGTLPAPRPSGLAVGFAAFVRARLRRGPVSAAEAADAYLAAHPDITVPAWALHARAGGVFSDAEAIPILDTPARVATFAKAWEDFTDADWEVVDSTEWILP